MCGGLKFIDCTGQCGILIADDCGVCGGNNAICTDCNGVINGEAEFDKCGDCVGGNTELVACNYDCLGIWGGDAKFDECGVCDGIVNYVSGTCNDCAGMPYGTAYIDGCEDCVGGNTGKSECTIDCTGLLGGTSVYDDCGVCVPEGDTSCVQSCDGSWVNDGTQLVFDECNVCGGDNTVCADCLGVPNGDSELDVCGVCEGDGICLPEHCTVGNVSGYCQDLSVLQEFIDNSLGTLNMAMDENGNGVIEPLELKSQEWVNGRLTMLNCWNEGLSGEIPSEIGNLTSLTYLNLWANQLTGEIPSEIGNLTSLIYLFLENNELTGEIPSEIGNLTNLTALAFSANQLSGEIPSEIGNLTNLTDLNLSDNQLTGGIPSEIGNLTNLTGLYLGVNELSGEIPSEIGNLTNLYQLSLYDNELTGELPSEIWELTNLATLSLNNNQLTGEIPSEIGSLMNLFILDLSANQLTGDIPESICNISYLTWSNDTSLARIDFNGNSYIYDNNLCPPYPSCIEDYVGEQDTSECPEPVIDYDGNVYETVQIGEQLWMAENLKVVKYKDGSEITHVPNNNDWLSFDEGHYSVYNNEPSNSDIYGNLYNWAVVNDDRGVCPEGWHVPTKYEWISLIDYGHNWYTADKHELNGTNESGLSVIRVGLRSYDGYWLQVGSYGQNSTFWTSSSDTPYSAYSAYFGDQVIVDDYWSPTHGYSIRCLKD